MCELEELDRDALLAPVPSGTEFVLFLELPTLLVVGKGPVERGILTLLLMCESADVKDEALETFGNGAPEGIAGGLKAPDATHS